MKKLTEQQKYELACIRFRGAKDIPKKERADYWCEATLHIESHIFGPQILADKDPVGALYKMIYNTRDINTIIETFQ